MADEKSRIVTDATGPDAGPAPVQPEAGGGTPAPQQEQPAPEAVSPDNATAPEQATPAQPEKGDDAPKEQKAASVSVFNFSEIMAEKKAAEKAAAKQGAKTPDKGATPTPTKEDGPKPEKPKELEKIVTNVVAKVNKKAEEKRPEKKKPEPPKKTAKELREERMRKMRESATQVDKKVTIEVRTAKASGDGRTARKTLSDAEVMRRLNEGYKPGTSEQIATSELQLGYSLIKQTFEEKWDKPPWTDTLKPMTIRVWFGGGGRIVKYHLERSSGDRKADQSILSAASRVGAIPALPAAFVDKFKRSGVPVQFTVKPM